jgi:hypothetical protein
MFLEGAKGEVRRKWEREDTGFSRNRFISKSKKLTSSSSS